MNPTEEQKSVSATPLAEASKPTAPVMDVVPPRPEKVADDLTPAEPAFIETPGEAVPMTPVEPPAEVSEDPDRLIEAEAKPPKQLESKPVKPPKQPGSDVSAAITATVVIVLGLAALAVFAYLQTK